MRSFSALPAGQNTESIRKELRVNRGVVGGLDDDGIHKEGIARRPRGRRLHQVPGKESIRKELRVNDSIVPNDAL